MSQVVGLLFKQITLGRFELDTSYPQPTNDSLEPVKMFLWCSTADNNIILVDNAGFHQPLKVAGALVSPKGMHSHSKKPSGPMVNGS